MARDPEQNTGVGTPRSAEESFDRSGGIDNSGTNTDVDPAVTTGATTSSHPANADGVDINRSGSGGTGGPGDDTDENGVGGGGPEG